MQLRDLSLKVSQIARYVMAGLIVLVFASWLLPCFTYSGITDKEVKATASLWSVLGFTKDYPQISALLDLKYVNLATLGVPVVLIVTGVIGFIISLLKKSIAITILPLIFSVYGIYGYLTDDFLGLINHTSSYIIPIVLLVLTLIATLVCLVFNIIEIRTRPEDYYLPNLGA